MLVLNNTCALAQWTSWRFRIPAGTTCWEALYFCSKWSCGSEFWICKIERWCCEAWIKSNLSLFNWCDCRIRSGRNMLWRQSNSLVDVLLCLVIMDLLIPGRRGAEGAWWKARLRVWWVGRQFLLYTFAMKEIKPSGRLKAGSSKQFSSESSDNQKKRYKMYRTYESRSNWQSGTIGIPRSIECILCYQAFDCPTGSVFSLHKTDIGSQHRWQSNAISYVIAWEFQVAPC